MNIYTQYIFQYYELNFCLENEQKLFKNPQNEIL